MAFEQRVEQQHKLQFAQAGALAAQQIGWKLRQHFTDVPVEGEASSPVVVFDASTAGRRSGRKPENRDNPANRRARWLIYDDPIEDGTYLDRSDVWRQAFDATSELNRTYTAAVIRGAEDVWAANLVGIAYEGKRASTTKALDAGMIVDVQFGESPAADVGLTIKKMREARRLLEKNEVDLDSEMPKLGITAQQHDDLRAFIEVTSIDFRKNEMPVMESGVVRKVMGFELVQFQRWPTDGTGATRKRKNPFWTKSGFAIGFWQDLNFRMWNDSHRNETPVMNVEIVTDGRRLHEDRVGYIECLDPE